MEFQPDRGDKTPGSHVDAPNRADAQSHTDPLGVPRMTNREHVLTATLIATLIVNAVLIQMAWIFWPAPQPVAPVPIQSAADPPAWHTKSMPVSTTGYQAFVGPRVYERDVGRAPIAGDRLRDGAPQGGRRRRR